MAPLLHFRESSTNTPQKLVHTAKTTNAIFCRFVKDKQKKRKTLLCTNLLRNKHLRPIVAILGVSHADVGE